MNASTLVLNPALWVKRADRANLAISSSVCVSVPDTAFGRGSNKKALSVLRPLDYTGQFGGLSFVAGVVVF